MHLNSSFYSWGWLGFYAWALCKFKIKIIIDTKHKDSQYQPSQHSRLFEHSTEKVSLARHKTRVSKEWKFPIYESLVNFNKNVKGEINNFKLKGKLIEVRAMYFTGSNL